MRTGDKEKSPKWIFNVPLSGPKLDAKIFANSPPVDYENGQHFVSPSGPTLMFCATCAADNLLVDLSWHSSSRYILRESATDWILFQWL
jgi:hypothetical protein